MLWLIMAITYGQPFDSTNKTFFILNSYWSSKQKQKYRFIITLKEMWNDENLNYK